jgi:type II secretory pathway component GspD/PulD (secretin)
LNFRDADIEAVAAAFSQLLGRSILVDARVKGRMSLESPRPVSKEQALALFQTALRMQLFAMVQVGESFGYCLKSMPNSMVVLFNSVQAPCAMLKKCKQGSFVYDMNWQTIFYRLFGLWCHRTIRSRQWQAITV